MHVMEPFTNNNNHDKNHNIHNNIIISPFVTKTYNMVNDPSTNDIISWGRSNNSFIVHQPLDFSKMILNSYFKHNNFSSFVRQLNTYGFRKVDPDKWEFANEWFLRGQIQLLKNIVRNKNHGKSIFNGKNEGEDGEYEENELTLELARLKRQQIVMDEELASMNKRIEATEKRPKQIMYLLSKVVDDPHILTRLIREKKGRMVEAKSRELLSQTEDNCFGLVKSSSSSAGGSCFESAPLVDGGYNWYDDMEGGLFVYHGGIVAAEDTNPPPYPFSLFGGSFD